MPWYKHGRPLEGYTAIILAQGPSLRDRHLQCQVQLASHLFPTIAIKDTYRFVPNAKIIYACDRSWWMRRWKERADLREHKAVKVTLDWEKIDTKVPNLQWLRCGSNTTFVSTEGMVASGHNSGHQTLNLTANLGAKKIILVAFDMCTIDGLSHCHDDHVPIPNDVFADFRSQMMQAAPWLAAKNIKVVNTSQHSKLTCFPKMSFKDAIEWGKYEHA